MGLSVNEEDCSDDSPVSSPAPQKKSFSVENILRPDFPQQTALPNIPLLFLPNLQLNVHKINQH